MTYYTTASYSSINYSQLTTLLSTEDFHNNNNHNNATLNLTTYLPEQPPESVYSFTEKIIIGIIAVIAVLCTVIGNFMVNFFFFLITIERLLLLTSMH